MPGEQKKVCIDVPYIDQSKLYRGTARKADR